MTMTFKSLISIKKSTNIQMECVSTLTSPRVWVGEVPKNTVPVFSQIILPILPAQAVCLALKLEM